MAPAGVDQHRWWKEQVVYQIYPASFNDSNGDGWGDVNGITEKLDYLKDLGVDIVWVSPIYKSPQKDMGYDISDYKDIDPMYGTLADVDRLIAELKARGMKLVMDLVVNHTSDQHEWFLQSRSSKSNPKRDWYIWKPPRYAEDGRRLPPNNWAQILGEANSAWTWDEGSGEYYLSLFTPEQPDLNWENEQVREAVFDVLRFWLDRGIVGFRMDVINLISKVQSFPDAEVLIADHEYQSGHSYFANGPRLHEWLKEMRVKVLGHYDTFTVGEMPFVRDEEEILRVVGQEEGELNMIFAFELVDIDNIPGDWKFTLHPWTVPELKRIINSLQRLMIDRSGWNSLFLENHDQPRSVSRYTDDSDRWREMGAKLLALMQTTLCGTLFVYQGEEIGMRNMPAEWPIEEYRDVEAVNFWKKMVHRFPHDTEKLTHARRILHRKSRDNARTPVQWSASPHAGFCPPTVTPWMRVNDDYAAVNADAQVSLQSDSTLSPWQFWQKTLEFRKRHKDVFVYGDFRMLDESHPEQVFVYVRESDGEKFVVALNFSGREVEWDIPGSLGVKGWVLGNAGKEKPERAVRGVLRMGPWEGLLGECEK
ncbi:glycoside hydrolase family 13 protein [Patellaria atrata CBS 101060]|uniref:Glycoside hydrolase family 13 protein n=1 Tax=Patellaria atrata CBS 101060 TaxID=1346257 RepID=A0A9P4SA01_9PEZI|nr:glycoside hydrolase family 13 protein [Patellaria atrata CBS 101060]